MLFKDQEEVKEHISVNHNFEIKDIEPSLRQAVNKYIIPAIGKEFFTELLAAYELGGATQKQLDAIYYIQDALANYSYFLYTAIGFVQIGNAGIQEANTDQASAARQWVTYDLKKALLDAGDVAMDFLLEFLEENADDYPTWLESKAYTVSREFFINNANDFSRFTNVTNSRRTFLALKPYIAKAERFFIKPTVSNELFAELKGAAVTGTVTPEQQDVIDLIMPALAQLALHKAIPELDLQVSADGIRVQSWNNGILKKEKATADQLSFLYRTLETDGNADLKTLQDFLFDNADLYPAFKDSKIYQETQYEGPKNCPGSKIFIA